MGDNFIGEIRMFGCNYPPRGWAQCNGALLPIQQNAALYSLLGGHYGNTTSTTFSLPDLRGRAILGQGPSVTGSPYYTCGQQVGSETVALTTTQVPAHNHSITASGDTANANPPTTNFLAKPVVSATTPTAIPLYATPGASTPPPIALDPGSVSSSGAGDGHQNMQPFLVMNYCIALTGVYPPRN